MEFCVLRAEPVALRRPGRLASMRLMMRPAFASLIAPIALRLAALGAAGLDLAVDLDLPDLGIRKPSPRLLFWIADLGFDINCNAFLAVLLDRARFLPV